MKEKEGEEGKSQLIGQISATAFILKELNCITVCAISLNVRALNPSGENFHRLQLQTDGYGGDKYHVKAREAFSTVTSIELREPRLPLTTEGSG